MNKDELTKQIEQLQEQLMKAEVTEAAAIREAQEKQFKQIIKDKGLNVEYVGDGLLFKKKTLSFGQLSNAVVDVESVDKAAPTKRKRSLEDYRPTDEDLSLANKLSNVDMRATDIYVFEPECANTETDIDNEEFDTPALDEMGGDCTGTPTLMDHERSIRSTIGKNMSGRVANKKLYIKFFVPDIESNKDLIMNIAFGVYNAVSVSCGIPIMEYVCSSCKRPMVSEACPHRPGMTDEKGNLVRGIIKHIQRFFELSLVWLGAQNNASIRRNPVPSGEKNATVGGETVDIPPSLPSNEGSENDSTNDFDRIPVDKKSVMSEGDNPVTEKKEQVQQTVDVAKSEDAPVETQPAQTEPEQKDETVTDKKEDAPVDQPEPAVKTVVADDAVKALASDVASLKDMLQALITASTENKQAIEELKASKAAGNEPTAQPSNEPSIEDLARGVLQVVAEAEQEQVSKTASAQPLTYVDRIRKALGTQSQQSI